LLQVLVNGLRRGDVVSRYSDAQYVLMLPGANFEDSQMVMNRITAAFRKHKYIPVKLNCKVRQLEIS
jgi:GGDEF domain-containing protein